MHRFKAGGEPALRWGCHGTYGPRFKLCVCARACVRVTSRRIYIVFLPPNEPYDEWRNWQRVHLSNRVSRIQISMTALGFFLFASVSRFPQLVSLFATFYLFTYL